MENEMSDADFSFVQESAQVISISGKLLFLMLLCRIATSFLSNIWNIFTQEVAEAFVAPG